MGATTSVRFPRRTNRTLGEGNYHAAAGAPGHGAYRLAEIEDAVCARGRVVDVHQTSRDVYPEQLLFLTIPHRTLTTLGLGR
jgi:hypothetical protein